MGTSLHLLKQRLHPGAQVLDVATGVVDVIDLVAVTDCGTVIHPRSLGAQCFGGSVQGMGLAMSQRWVFDPQYGVPFANRLYTARPPSIMDIPTNYGPGYSAAFADMYHRIAEEEGATLVPGFVREVGMDPALMQPDGLHPTAEGHRRLAEKLLPYLEEAITESTGVKSGPSPGGAADG